MTEHTATPWEMDKAHPDGIAIYGEADGRQIALVNDDVDEVDANAAFIVRAANSHAALVEALRAVEWVGLLMGDHTCEMCPQCWSHKQGGHAPDCQLDKALRAANPD